VPLKDFQCWGRRWVYTWGMTRVIRVPHYFYV
jgi:hypothetical protein